MPKRNSAPPPAPAMPNIKFDRNDAQDLVNLARRAPLRDMDESERAIALVTRFAIWASTELPVRQKQAAPPKDEGK